MSNQNTIDAQNVILKLGNTINFPKYPQFAYITVCQSVMLYRNRLMTYFWAEEI